MKYIELYNKGVELCAQGNLEEAIEMFKEAITLNPRFTDAHYNLAVTYYALSRFSEAKEEYEIVLKLRPNDVDALNNLGVILAMRGLLEQAKELFDKALNIDPGFPLTHRNLAAYYERKGDTVKTTEHERRARELDEEVFDREPGPPWLSRPILD